MEDKKPLSFAEQRKAKIESKMPKCETEGLCKYRYNRKCTILLETYPPDKKCTFRREH